MLCHGMAVNMPTEWYKLTKHHKVAVIHNKSCLLLLIAAVPLCFILCFGHIQKQQLLNVQLMHNIFKVFFFHSDT